MLIVELTVTEDLHLFCQHDKGRENCIQSFEEAFETYKGITELEDDR